MAQDSQLASKFQDKPTAIMQTAKENYYEKNKDKINLARRIKRLANLDEAREKKDRNIKRTRHE